MSTYTIGFDDVLTSKLTKQTTVASGSLTCDSTADFVEKFNEISQAMGNRDGYTKVVCLVADGDIITGATLRYLPKKKAE